MKDRDPLKEKIEGKALLLKLQNYCAYQERSQHEVREKIYAEQTFGQEAEQLITKLIEEGFLNEERFALVMEVITAVRTIRSDMKVPLAKKPALTIATNAETAATLEALSRYLTTLAGLSGLSFQPEGSAAPAGSVSAICTAGTLYLPLGELVDVAQEIARAEKELVGLQKEIAGIEGKLNNPGFTGKAPAQVVEAERQRLTAGQEKLARLQERIAGLKELK